MPDKDSYWYCHTQIEPRAVRIYRESDGKSIYLTETETAVFEASRNAMARTLPGDQALEPMRTQLRMLFETLEPIKAKQNRVLGAIVHG